MEGMDLSFNSREYVLDVPSLKLGDIILTADSKPGSLAIRTVTNADFSHVMLYVGKSLIHAEPAGVFSKNPQRHLRGRKDHIRVLRFQSLSHEQALAVCSFARSKIGGLYSKSEAFRSITEARSSRARSMEQFCSRLVAQAFNSVGIDLVNNPDYCTPGDFQRSPILEEIKGVVREATSREIKYSKTPDTVLDHQRDTYRWLKRARAIAFFKRVDLQTMNDVLFFLEENPGCDKDVVKAIRKTGYLQHRERDRGINPYRYDPLLCLAMIKKENISPFKYVFSELSREYTDLRFGYELAKFKAAPANLEYVFEHCQLYEALLRISDERCQVLELVAGLTGNYALSRAALRLSVAFKEAIRGPGEWEEVFRQPNFPLGIDETSD